MSCGFDDWDCTICGITNCEHLALEDTSESVISDINMLPEPESHKSMNESDLIIIKSNDGFAFRLAKDKIPPGSIIDVMTSDSWNRSTTNLDLSKSVLELVHDFFFYKQNDHIFYKDVGYWKDVMSEKYAHTISPLTDTDLKTISYVQHFEEPFASNWLPMFANTGIIPRGCNTVLPKVYGKMYPTRAFVRILSEYLNFPHILEPGKRVSLEQDYKTVRKIHQAKMHEYN
ncbi:hypothetical protein QKC54_gp0727 [Megavirus baoshan]|uniref:Uncharacterized protein n=2 Tax=Megavirus baoshan TaxID=2496520 RepID=A0A8K1T159_9VIRU|nr:hypothetical protein QKC54_gp0727 [Megavirus baoshan]UFX99800.1 hypothetical protein Mb0345 [Megavirus baoshan]